MAILGKALKQGLCQRGMRVNVLPELGYNVRVVYLKRTRVNRANDTSNKVPMIQLLKLLMARSRLMSGCLQLVKFIHISIFMERKRRINQNACQFPYLKVFL